MLEHKVRMLRGNLESHDNDVEELMAEILRQSDCYNDLWCANGMSLEDV